MTDDTATLKEAGILETIKENLHPSHIMKKLNLTSNNLLEMAIYLGVGFLAGYILKKYGKYLIVAMIIILILLLFQQLGVIAITFNASKLQELFGMYPTTSSESKLIGMYWEWIKANVVLVVSFSIGFLVGLRSA